MPRFWNLQVRLRGAMCQQPEPGHLHLLVCGDEVVEHSMPGFPLASALTDVARGFPRVAALAQSCGFRPRQSPQTTGRAPRP